MFNEHDLQEIHRDAARSMPRFERASTTTANPTKMNVIVPIIPEPTREIMDLTLLAIGAELNILLCLAIASSPSMRTSVNCYVASLACANLAILLEPLQQALRWIFDVDLRMNLDYVFLVTFYASALTMILIHVETYVVVCQKSSYLREPLVRVSTAAKGLLFVWTCCVTLTAMELHMYDHVDRTVTYDICVSSTIMFLIFPCCVFVLLDYFVLYDLTVSKSIDGKWPDEDTERFLLSAGITVGFVLSMMPYRIMKAATLVTSFCCSDTTVEVVYTMVKLYPIIMPVTCFALSKDFRRTTLRCCKRQGISTAIEQA